MKKINRKIVFGDTEILVESAGAIMSSGKTVLEIVAKEENATEEMLKQLKYNREPIEYYEQEASVDEDTGMALEEGEWSKKNTYLDYDSGDYASSYRGGLYTCWVTRMGEMERGLKKVRADIARISEMSGISLG